MEDHYLKLKENISKLKKEINMACAGMGRDPDEIIIVAAAKYADASGIGSVLSLGLDNFGENRADELIKKSSKVPEGAIWHFIGHLQSRKAKIVVPLVEYIHSIDKISTLEKVDHEALKSNKLQKILIEVNISGEETKYGIDPGRLSGFISEAKIFKNIEIKGLMTMAPYTRDMDLIRSTFRDLRILKERSSKEFRGLALTELSMGMSNDFRIAIEEGATMIRVGSIIFK